MKPWTMAVLAVLAAGAAGAETLRSQSLEAEISRRAVSMTSKTGNAIAGEQVYVALRRLDGTPIGAGQLPDYVGFAEKAACGARTVLVSLMVGAEQGGARYEVLCARGQ